MMRWFILAALATGLFAASVDAQFRGRNAPPRTDAMAPDTVLADNGVAQVTRADFDLELTKLPPNLRGGFATNEKRVVDLINRLLVTKTLAAQADAAGILKDPEVARRVEVEFQRVKAQLMTQRIEAEAAARFDAEPRQWEARARDLYAIDAKKYAVPEQVSASHILFAVGPRKSDEARALALEARAAVAAGQDFNELAREKSDDPSAKANAGRLGFFGRGQMDRSFEVAAFALERAGDLSDPVESAFGWHLIRLDGRRAASQRSFEEAKSAIVADLRTQFIAAERDRRLEEIRAEGYASIDPAIVQAIVVPTDTQTIERVHQDAARRLREQDKSSRAK